MLVSREDEFSSRLSSRAGFRGCTALHYATLADDPHAVRMLLEAGRLLLPTSKNLSDSNLETKEDVRVMRIPKSASVEDFGIQCPGQFSLNPYFMSTYRVLCLVEKVKH